MSAMTTYYRKYLLQSQFPFYSHIPLLVLNYIILFHILIRFIQKSRGLTRYSLSLMSKNLFEEFSLYLLFQNTSFSPLLTILSSTFFNFLVTIQIPFFLLNQSMLSNIFKTSSLELFFRKINIL